MMDYMLDDVVAGARCVAAARSLHTAGELGARCDVCDARADVPCSEGGIPCGPHRGRKEAAERAATQMLAKASRDEVERVRRTLLEADVPAELAQAVMGGRRRTEALEQAETWVRSARTSLVFCGARGVGKSYAAAWIVTVPDRARVRGVRAMWMQAAELVAMDSWDRRLPVVRRCGLLVIDELGAGDSRSDRVRERLDSVWCVRSDRGLDTVATTNSTVEELREVLDERLRDRLRLHGQVDGLDEVVSLRSGRGLDGR